MRMIMYVTYGQEKFNAAMRDGTVGTKIKRIMEDIKPEAIYFCEQPDGQRGAVVVVDIPSPDQLSRFTEPWFLSFDAKVKARIAMTPEDVAKIDLDGLAKKYC